MKLKIVSIVGARPNFMKSAPLMKEFEKRSDKIESFLIHTGQHYDHDLSTLFFDELRMRKPDEYLGVGSASHAVQTAKIMIGLEEIFTKIDPDLVVVFGDVNSTMAAALVASKMGIKLAHVEAGLRSYDPDMPEEVNRIVTDRLSDLLFVSEPSGLENLAKEGYDSTKIFHVGNIMIDSLIANLDIAKKSDILDKIGLRSKNYVAVTMHRPSNVDNEKTLTDIVLMLSEVSQKIPIAFPCHPRTKKYIEKYNLTDKIDPDKFKLIDPLGYLDFLKLQSEAGFIITDSGGIQEESTYLEIPCLTVRENTERPVTITEGSNILCGVDTEKILMESNKILDGNPKKGSIPKFWDGNTAERIVDQILIYFNAD